MAKFPEPPDAATLARIAPLTLTLDRGTRLARIYFMGDEYPGRWNGFRHFGPTASRWDHHLLDEHGRPGVQSRGVLYAASGPEAIPTCLAEVFQQRRVVERRIGRPALVGFELAAPLTLLDLTGTLSHPSRCLDGDAFGAAAKGAAVVPGAPRSLPGDTGHPVLLLDVRERSGGRAVRAGDRRASG